MDIKLNCKTKRDRLTGGSEDGIVVGSEHVWFSDVFSTLFDGEK